MSAQRLSLVQVRVHNVKSIEDCTLDLGESNYVFGANNSGKSNLLFALNLAFGNARMEADDMFCSADSPFSEDKTAHVDLLFRPTDGGDFSDEWRRALGPAIRESQGEEHFAFRASFTFDGRNNSYRRTRQVIGDWYGLHNVSDHLTESETRHFECFLIDAQRDISEDIRNRQSLWSRRISRMDLPDEVVSRFNETVGELNRVLVGSSPLLLRLGESLTSVPTNGDLVITPLPASISDIYNGLDIKVVENGNSIPVSSIGLGSRSIATIKAIQALSDMASETDDPHYVLILLEEPEEHLHPQLQKRMAVEIADMGVQHVITTHSPFILSKAGIDDMIHTSHDGASTRFSGRNLSGDRLDKAQESLELDVHDILFSRVVVLFEGKTEQVALPVFFEGYFGYPPETLNVSFQGVGGTNYLPFLQLIREFELDWFVFSDGEERARNNLNRMVTGVFGESVYELADGPDGRVLMIPDGGDFESYIAGECYDTASAALRQHLGDKGLDKRLREYGGQDSTGQLASVLRSSKAEYAKVVAEALVKRDEYPPLIRELMDRIKRRLAS